MYQNATLTTNNTLHLIKNEEPKVISITRDIEKRNAELEKINSELMMFSYAVTHDLKQPARLLKIYFDMVKKTLEPKMDEREKEFCGIMYSNANLMLEMLDSLNNYSAIDTLDVAKEEVDLKEVVHNLLPTLEKNKPESDISINIGDLPQIETYPLLFKRLFLNILQNAIKYARPNSKTYIDISYSEENGKKTIKIIDNGIGIPQNQQNNIFKLFKRASNHKDIEGSGVGLAYCHKIMNSLKGSIDIFSEGENLGTTVTLSF